MADDVSLEAVVGKVQGEGGRRYVVAYARDGSVIPKDTTVTFSLKVWQGEGEPEPGQVVRLADIVEFAKGWRARRAEPVTPSTRRSRKQ